MSRRTKSAELLAVLVDYMSRNPVALEKLWPIEDIASILGVTIAQAKARKHALGITADGKDPGDGRIPLYRLQNWEHAFGKAGVAACTATAFEAVPSVQQLVAKGHLVIAPAQQGYGKISHATVSEVVARATQAARIAGRGVLIKEAEEAGRAGDFKASAELYKQCVHFEERLKISYELGTSDGAKD